MIWKFGCSERVPKEHPDHYMFAFYKRLKAGGNLSREEKDRLANSLWMGAGSSIYRLAGWAVSFSDVLPTYLVKYPYDAYWTERVAPDKTSLRKALRRKVTILTKPEK